MIKKRDKTTDIRAMEDRRGGEEERRRGGEEERRRGGEGHTHVR